MNFGGFLKSYVFDVSMFAFVFMTMIFYTFVVMPSSFGSTIDGLMLGLLAIGSLLNFVKCMVLYTRYKNSGF